MRISQEKFCARIARALLDGYFLGVEEEKQRARKSRETLVLASIFKRQGPRARTSIMK